MAVMYSMDLVPRCFKWKMLSLSGPRALLFLQLLIALLTRSVVNVCAISKNLLFFSLVTNRVSLEEVCLPSFDVLNCWLNQAAICLDGENKLPLKVIASFSTSRFALPSIPLMVLHSLVTSVFWSKVSTVQARWDLFYGVHLIISNISAGTGSSWSLCRPVRMWCDTALSRAVYGRSTHLSVGRECLLRAAYTSCLYLSQLAFFRLT